MTYTFFFNSVHKRFAKLDEEIVKQDKNAKLSKELIMDLPELKVICLCVTFPYDLPVHIL